MPQYCWLICLRYYLLFFESFALSWRYYLYFDFCFYFLLSSLRLTSLSVLLCSLGKLFFHVRRMPFPDWPWCWGWVRFLIHMFVHVFRKLNQPMKKLVIKMLYHLLESRGRVTASANEISALLQNVSYSDLSSSLFCTQWFSPCKLPLGCLFISVSFPLLITTRYGGISRYCSVWYVFLFKA